MYSYVLMMLGRRGVRMLNVLLARNCCIFVGPHRSIIASYSAAEISYALKISFSQVDMFNQFVTGTSFANLLSIVNCSRITVKHHKELSVKPLPVHC